MSGWQKLKTNSVGVKTKVGDKAVAKPGISGGRKAFGVFMGILMIAACIGVLLFLIILYNGSNRTENSTAPTGLASLFDAGEHKLGGELIFFSQFPEPDLNHSLSAAQIAAIQQQAKNQEGLTDSILFPGIDTTA